MLLSFFEKEEIIITESTLWKIEKGLFSTKQRELKIALVDKIFLKEVRPIEFGLSNVLLSLKISIVNILSFYKIPNNWVKRFTLQNIMIELKGLDQFII